MNKLTYPALMLTLTLGAAQMSCESKTNRKADEVAEAKQDVATAQQAGGTKEEVMDKQADLELARKDFKKTWDTDRDAVRKKINKSIENIDEKTATFERGMKTAAGEAKTKMATGLVKLKEERATLTGLLKQLDQVTAANWDVTRKAIRTVKNGVDDRVKALKK